MMNGHYEKDDPRSYGVAGELSVRLRVLLLLLITICVAMTAWSFSWGLADLAAGSSRAKLKSWESSGRVDAPGWGKAKRNIDFALTLNPYSADYWSNSAMIYSWAALSSQSDTQRTRAFRAVAIERLEQALERRPSWGYAWARLAELELQQSGVNARALGALQRAMLLSPRETEVNRKVLSIGIAIWPVLPEVMREGVVNAVKNALSHYRNLDYIIRVALQRNWQKHLEPLLLDDFQRQRFRKLLRKR